MKRKKRKEFQGQLDSGVVNPMELKKRLAREIVTQLYDQKAAAVAENRFEQVHQRGQMPEDIEEFRIPLGGEVDLREIMVKTGQAGSRSEAQRLIVQGGVSIDGELLVGWCEAR